MEESSKRLGFRKPRGIVSVVQTPFDADNHVDAPSLVRLVQDAIASGVNGFLAPAVASEVGYLSEAEREVVVETIAMANANRVPLVVGASSDDIATCQK
jgi:dihydrodipicolinate synthase/N-acetylneuraminate lyase